MRFRCNVTNVATFMRLVQAMDRVFKTCTVVLEKDKMRLIHRNESEGGVQVWSQVDVDSIFDDYRIESNSDNKIHLEASTESLLRALRSASDSDEVLVRLVKKGKVPMLAFHISSLSRQGNKMRISQEVPIRLLKPVDVAALTEPMCPEPDVHIVLPRLAAIRTVVDRLRSLGNILQVSASAEGELRIGLASDEVKVETGWKGLKQPEMEIPVEGPARGVMHSVHVQVKSLTKFLSTHAIATTTVACICANHCLILYVYIGSAEHTGGVLTFFIPAHVLDED